VLSRLAAVLTSSTAVPKYMVLPQKHLSHYWYSVDRNVLQSGCEAQPLLALSYTHRPHLAPPHASAGKSPKTKAPKKHFWCKTRQGCSQPYKKKSIPHIFGQLGRENFPKPPPSHNTYPAHLHAAQPRRRYTSLAHPPQPPTEENARTTAPAPKPTTSHPYNRQFCTQRTTQIFPHDTHIEISTIIRPTHIQPVSIDRGDDSDHFGIRPVSCIGLWRVMHACKVAF
jgi:hypothetical protein